MDKQAILNHFNGDFIRFYSKFLVELQQAGKEYKTRCPFHEDKTPSLSIKPDTGLFHCFGCGAKGDIFDFYGKLNRLDAFPVILSGIASDFGISDNMACRSRLASQESKPPSCKKEETRKTYDYLDPQGLLQFEKTPIRPQEL